MDISNDNMYCVSSDWGGRYFKFLFIYLYFISIDILSGDVHCLKILYTPCIRYLQPSQLLEIPFKIANNCLFYIPNIPFFELRHTVETIITLKPKLKHPRSSLASLLVGKANYCKENKWCYLLYLLCKHSASCIVQLFLVSKLHFLSKR